ncbi:MAG: hypothetical protein BWZ03_00064 [bacterium ADurb.BinA186]|nr:MAG: hypothetical protein BWZ03_00064 [bacterium ADurb.BinA186]
MIRWYVDKDGNKKLQKLTTPYGGEKITLEKILKCKFVFERWEDVPTEYEIKDDIISDTPIEDKREAQLFDSTSQEYINSSLMCIDGHEIVNTGKDSEDRNVYRTKGDLFKVLTEPAPRRQFDVSKLKEKIEQRQYGQRAGEDHALRMFNHRLDVLEAWNNGTIEELLEGWTK